MTCWLVIDLEQTPPNIAEHNKGVQWMLDGMLDRLTRDLLINPTTGSGMEQLLRHVATNLVTPGWGRDIIRRSFLEAVG